MGLLTKLADVIVGVGLWHGCDSNQWAAVSPKCFTEDVLSEIDLRGPQILQFWQVHLYKQLRMLEFGNVILKCAVKVKVWMTENQSKLLGSFAYRHRIKSRCYFNSLIQALAIRDHAGLVPFHMFNYLQ